MSAGRGPNGGRNGDFDQFRGDIEAAERKIAGEIEPGARAMVVAVLVFVVLVTLHPAPHRRGQGMGCAGR